MLLLDPPSSSETYKRQIYETCITAAQLLLFPENVLNITLYWLSQYNNYLLVNKEEECFNDFISGLLVKKPKLTISVSEGLAHHRNDSVGLISLIHFVGGASHDVPLEYFVNQNQVTLIDSLSRLTQSSEKYFLRRNLCGLEGELSLSGFRYDYIFEYFYEPSFIIITAYLLNMLLLRKITIGMDWLVRHNYSILAINEENLSQAACFSDEERLKSMASDLRKLHTAINRSDINEAIEFCTELWQEKAAYCYSQMFIRRNELFY
jgi:hypothetical protein